MEEQRRANGHSCHLVVVATGSDNACLGCGGNISGQDKRVKEGGGGGSYWMGAKARGHGVQSQRGALDRGQQVDLLCLSGGGVSSPHCECEMCVTVILYRHILAQTHLHAPIGTRRQKWTQ